MTACGMTKNKKACTAKDAKERKGEQMTGKALRRESEKKHQPLRAIKGRQIVILFRFPLRSFASLAVQELFLVLSAFIDG
jgi:hypothetical protein